jgi:predicted TIM-barrel fold metal-dependent hydrolase
MRRYPIISVDDHIVEPPHTFDDRVPSGYRDVAPRVVTRADGSQTWLFDGQELPNVGFNAVVGRPVAEFSFEPTRFDEMRRGAWDISERIRDMDLNGVWSSLCFPSFLPGFCGQRLQLGVSDSGLALASVRAWNDWMLDEWHGTYPDRIIPMQLPILTDPELAATEIRANAARGCTAVTFSEAPEKLGLPSLHTGYWDPFLAACEETGTVVCLHVGSSSSSPTTNDDAPPDVTGVLFFGYAMFAAVDWLYSRVAVRFPQLKICLSEGGIGWVAGLMDRLDHVLNYQDMYGTWEGIDLTPREVLQRNFWFCGIDDASGFEQRHRIGVDHVLVESDYPHCDSSWPNTQELLNEQIGTFPPAEVAKLTWQNAAALFRQQVPASVVADPDAPWPSEIDRGTR